MPGSEWQLGWELPNNRPTIAKPFKNSRPYAEISALLVQFTDLE
jgi:hypothetical protein